MRLSDKDFKRYKSLKAKQNLTDKEKLELNKLEELRSSGSNGDEPVNVNNVFVTNETVNLTASDLLEMGDKVATEFNFVQFDMNAMLNHFERGSGKPIEKSKALMDSVINSYAIARGYLTTVTANDIYELNFRSLRYLSAIKSYFKYNNRAKVKDNRSREIGQLLNSVHTTNIGGVTMSSVSNYVFDGVAYTRSTKVNNVPVSNALWAELLQGLDTVRTTKHFYDMISYYLEDSFVIDDTQNATTFVDFIDVSVKQDNVVSHIRQLISNLETFALSKPDLLQIADFIGLNNGFVVSQDFTRDLSKNTLNLRVDDTIALILNNSMVGAPSTSDEDIISIYEIPLGSPLGAVDDIIPLNANLYAHLRLFREIKPSTQLFIMQEDGTIINDHPSYGTLADYVQYPPAYNPEHVLPRLKEWIKRTKSILHQRFVNIELLVNFTQKGIAFRFSDEYMTEDGYYWVDAVETNGVLYEYYPTELLLGADWRVQLQTKAAQLRGGNLPGTKQ